MDPYKTLGVSTSASRDEIRNAYRALAKKFHPDLNPKDKAAEQKFKEINAAYEILGDPANRAKFDRGEWDTEAAGAGPHRRHEGPFYRETRGRGAGARYASDFAHGFDEDIFADLFRGRAGSEGITMPGADEHYRLELGLKEAVEGGERELQLPSGKRLAVKIPKGVVAGQKLRFAGQGGPGLGGGPAGDIFVELAIAPDERFQVDGSSLVHELTVPLEVALLGGAVEVPTPEGQIQLKVPAHTGGGRRLRVPGKGLPVRGGKRGDLFVKVQIGLPNDPSLDEAVRAWRDGGEGRAS
jgi:DnaJ-class molecular chaperone